MFSVSVDDLPLSNKERASLRRADLVNAAQILYASPSENATLRQLFDSTHFEHIQEKAALAQAPRSYSILELLEEREIVSIKKEKGEDAVASDEVTASRENDTDIIAGPERYTISTGDIAIDGLLGGGIRRGCLTEIVGESSSGKSQLGMQTAVFTAVGFVPIMNQSTLAASNESDDLFEALAGRGIRPKSQTGSVAILNSGGAAVSRMMTRRMVELSNSLVAERWKQGRDNADMSPPEVIWSTPSLQEEKPGLFRDDFKRSSLEEAQEMAKARLLDNIKLCSPKDYESLEHTVSFFLPALFEDLQEEGKAPLTLVIVDDLPMLLIDDRDANMTQKEHTLRRSRCVCEIADRLKRLSVSGSGSSPDSAVAIMVMNQVIDAMASNKRLLLPLLLQNALSDEDSLLHTIEGPPPLSSAFQDGFYNGLLASADIHAITKARKDIAEGRDEDEALNRISSTSKMAALGHSWVNCINVRVMLTRTSRLLRRNHKEKITIRRAVSVLNPFAKAGQGWDPHVEYAILPEGLKSIHSISTHLHSNDNDEEDALWSSFDTDFKSNDVDILTKLEEQTRIDEEDEYLWAMSSDLDDDLELPDI